ncbi:MAG: hypothetical protein ACOX53_00125 [Limnochordia bacterium]
MKKAAVLSLVLVLLLVGTSTALAQRINITFWYSLSGNAGRVFQDMVAEFNSSQDRIFVDAVYTGGYGDTAQKVTAALAANTLPEGGLIPAAPLFTGRVGNYLIDEYLRGPKGLDMDDFYDEFWNYNKYDGTHRQPALQQQHTRGLLQQRHPAPSRARTQGARNLG